MWACCTGQAASAGIGELIRGLSYPGFPQIRQESVEHRRVGRVDMIELRLAQPLQDFINVFG